MVAEGERETHGDSGYGPVEALRLGMQRGDRDPLLRAPARGVAVEGRAAGQLREALTQVREDL